MPRARTEPPQIDPTYGPLVPCCKAHGIPKTTAWALVKTGQLQHFKIGGRAFVMLDSLRTLPERIAKGGGR